MLSSLRQRFPICASQGFLNIVRQNSTDYICVNENNGVREIKMIHQKTRNALGLDMMQYLINTINCNKDDVNLRAIVISAEGNVFSAGHNLKEMHECEGIEKQRNIFLLATKLMLAMVNSPVPIIAKVNGMAAAAGCQLVAASDIVVCSDKSKFSTPGANFGVFCSTPGVALSRTVHKSTALYMLFTGDPITAKEAHAAGLVTKVVDESALDEEVAKIVDKIKAKSRFIVSLGKQFYYKQIDMPLKEAYEAGGDLMVYDITTCDGQEGINSFIEKRPPIWNHEK